MIDRQTLARVVLDAVGTCSHCDDRFELGETLLLFQVGFTEHDPVQRFTLTLSHDEYDEIILHESCWGGIRKEQYEELCTEREPADEPGVFACCLCRYAIPHGELLVVADAGSFVASVRTPLGKEGPRAAGAVWRSQEEPVCLCYECVCDMNEREGIFWDDFLRGDNEYEEEQDDDDEPDDAA